MRLKICLVFESRLAFGGSDAMSHPWSHRENALAEFMGQVPHVTLILLWQTHYFFLMRDFVNDITLENLHEVFSFFAHKKSQLKFHLSNVWAINLHFFNGKIEGEYFIKSGFVRVFIKTILRLLHNSKSQTFIRSGGISDNVLYWLNYRCNSKLSFLTSQTVCWKLLLIVDWLKTTDKVFLNENEKLKKFELKEFLKWMLVPLITSLTNCDFNFQRSGMKFWKAIENWGSLVKAKKKFQLRLITIYAAEKSLKLKKSRKPKKNYIVNVKIKRAKKFLNNVAPS